MIVNSDSISENMTSFDQQSSEEGFIDKNPQIVFSLPSVSGEANIITFTECHRNLSSSVSMTYTEYKMTVSNVEYAGNFDCNLKNLKWIQVNEKIFKHLHENDVSEEWIQTFTGLMHSDERLSGYVSAQDTEEKSDLDKKFQKTIPSWKRNDCKSIDPIDFSMKRKFDPVRHDLSDIGNSNRFIDECPNEYIYDTSMSENMTSISKKTTYSHSNWYYWNVNRYTRAAEAQIMKSAMHVSKSIYSEDSYFLSEVFQGDKDAFTAFYKSEFKPFCKKSCSVSSLNNMLSLASNSKEFAVNLDKDSNKDLIAVKNGMINTATGEYTPLHECRQFKNQYPQYYIDCNYVANAYPEKFLSFIRELMTDNTSLELSETEIKTKCEVLTRYLLHILGYMLVKGNPERKLVFFQGSGGNGKSALCDIISEVFGSQVKIANSKELFVKNAGGSQGTIQEGISSARIVICAEADTKENTYSSSWFKTISGDQQVVLRQMYHNGEVKTVTGTLLLVCNIFPAFDEFDNALIDRCIIIPFMNKPKKKNLHIAEEIVKKEKDLIFSYLIDEMRKYLETGLSEIPSYCKCKKLDNIVGIDLSDFIEKYVTDTHLTTKEKTTNKEIFECVAFFNHMSGGVEISDYFSGTDLILNDKREVLRKLRLAGFVDAGHGSQRGLYLTIDKGKLYRDYPY